MLFIYGKKKGEKESKIIRCIKAPIIKVVIKVRDFYMRKLWNNYSENVVYGCLMGCSATPQLPSWPIKTFSGDEDFTRTNLGNMVESMHLNQAKSSVRVVPMGELQYLLET